MISSRASVAGLQKTRADHRSPLLTTSQSPRFVERWRARAQADRVLPVPTAKLGGPLRPPRPAPLSSPLRPPRPAPLARSARLDRFRRMVRLCPLPRRVCLRPLPPLSPGARQVGACRQPQLLLPHVPAAPRAGTTRSPGRGRPSPGPESRGQRVSPSPGWQASRPAVQSQPPRPSLSGHQTPPRRDRGPRPPGPASPSRHELPPRRDRGPRPHGPLSLSGHQTPPRRDRRPGRRGLPSRPARLERSKRCCRRRQPGRFPRRPQTPRVRKAVGERPASSPARRCPQVSLAVREGRAVSLAVRQGRPGRPDGAGSDRSSASRRP
jgi:hypothetical protein